MMFQCKLRLVLPVLLFGACSGSSGDTVDPGDVMFAYAPLQSIKWDEDLGVLTERRREDYEYDGHGRLTRWAQLESEYSDTLELFREDLYTYQESGRIDAVTAQGYRSGGELRWREVTRYVYDDEGRVAGAEIQMEHLLMDPVVVVDETILIERDGLGRPERSVRTSGSTGESEETRYLYDENSEAIAEIATGEKIATYTFDAQDRLVQRSFTEGYDDPGVSDYLYDAAGFVTHECYSQGPERPACSPATAYTTFELDNPSSPSWLKRWETDYGELTGSYTEITYTRTGTSYTAELSWSPVFWEVMSHYGRGELDRY